MRTPRPKEKIYIKTNPEYCRGNDGGKYCVVESYILDTVWVKPKYSRGGGIDVRLGDIDYLDPEELSGDEKRSIVRKIVKKEHLLDFKDMSRELRILNHCVEKFPDLLFWRQFSLDFQLASLAWFIGGGAKELRIRYNLFTMDLTVKKEEVKLEDGKIGEDLVIKKKARSMMDMMR